MKEALKRFPGISCARADEKGHVCCECYGVADRENQIPTDEKTIFPACSISKWITAICVMRLRELGALELDRPVHTYLSGWRVCDWNGKECDISLRHLLSHTSGICDGEDRFVRSAPGSVFEYSDAGFCVIQSLLENIAGKRFEDLARELVFDELGLCDIFFGTRANIELYGKKARLAAGYMGDGSAVEGKYLICPDLAASGLWSSPGELVRVAVDFAASMDGHGRILSRESVNEMIKPAFGFPWVGLGLFRYGDDAIVSKGWAENGQCMLKINRRNHRIGAVMTNRDPEAPQEESGVEKLVDEIMEAAVKGTEIRD